MRGEHIAPQKNQINAKEYSNTGIKGQKPIRSVENK